MCAPRGESQTPTPQSSDPQNLQEFLFKALTKTCLIESRDTACYSRCARTDKGVSALANVVSLRVRSKLQEGLGVVPPGTPTELSERCDINLGFGPG